MGRRTARCFVGDLAEGHSVKQTQADVKVFLQKEETFHPRGQTKSSPGKPQTMTNGDLEEPQNFYVLTCSICIRWHANITIAAKALDKWKCGKRREQKNFLISTAVESAAL